MPPRKDHLRGTLDALILKTLTFGPRHGYAIVAWLRDQTRNGLEVEEGSLYPALDRMERDGWIKAEWGTCELGRNAKFYRITEAGLRALQTQTEDFASFVAVVSPLLLPGWP